MHRILPATVLIAIITLVALSSQVSFAKTEHASVVFLIDRAAVTNTESGLDITKSILGLVATLREDQPFSFLGLDEPGEVLGPILPTSQEYSQFQLNLSNWLSSGDPSHDVELLWSIFETSMFLDSTLAPAGSTIYLIVGQSSETDISKSNVRLDSLSSVFEENGWTLITLELTQTSEATRNSLRTMSSALGGKSIELSGPQGFQNLANQILKAQQKGALGHLSSETLRPSDVLTLSFSIVPGTREANLLVFKENAEGSLRISNPAGLESSVGDRTSSFVMETPNAVIWKLIDPSPGTWQVNLRGIQGAVSLWQYSVNRYTPVLQPFGTTPLNEPATLTAFIYDGLQITSLGGIKLTARVTSPQGTTLVHTLNDAGRDGDRVAGDGYFSVSIPPLTTGGQYLVELELSWPEFPHKVTSTSDFNAEAFPALEITLLKTEELEPGIRTKIANILVHIEEDPFAVQTDAITHSMNSNLPIESFLEIKPKRMLDENRAWSYEVYFTTQGEALHTVLFGLNIEYLERNYTYTSHSTILSSMPLLTPVQQVQPVSTSTPSGPVTPQHTPAPASKPGVYWPLLSIPGVLLLLLLFAGIYWSRQTRPYGLIYSDRNELIVDFASLKRSLLMTILSKDLVWGKELDLPGFDGVSVKFTGDSIRLQNRQTTPTLRVNNQPLTGQFAINDKTWIGSQGRLYIFRLSSVTSPKADGMADAG